MTVTHLALIYLVVGVGWAGLHLHRHPTGAGAVDATLLVVVWPLYGPLVTGRRPDSPLLAVLQAALPEGEAAARLARTIQVLDGRIARLDALLAQSDFDPQAAAARVEILLAQGHAAAAQAAQRRVTALHRLAETRARSVAARATLDELLAHLRTQVELARFTGAGDGAEATLAELTDLVGTLDALLDDEVLAAA
ncbi:MAG: hypothetical protein H6702_10550 [Myxococcales bacterium]|nr:hypothetical protein [Myxococcales bacterium]